MIKAIYILFVLIFIMVIYVAMLLLDGSMPTEFLNQTFAVDQSSVRVGEQVSLRNTINKHYPSPVEAHWRLICSNTSYPLPSYITE